MKKTLLLFVFLMVAGTWLFSLSNMDEQKLYGAIAKAPAYAPATAHGIVEKKMKRMKSYHVQYTYLVGGATYHIDSAGLSPEQAQALMARPDAQVVHVAGEPQKAALKHDFELRDKTAGMSGAIVDAALTALFFSVIVCVVFAFKFGWFKRGAV